MKVVLTGGTGFIGDHVSQHLAHQEYEIVALTRRAGQSSPHGLSLRFVQWDAESLGSWAQELDGADAIIHLAGEGIFDSRWTHDVKHRISQSRIRTTQLLVQAIAQAKRPPALFISASAVGYYGHRNDELTDESSPAGTDFLADVCVRWEAEAAHARQYGVRVVHPRLGVVLGKNGGALARLIPLVQGFLGTPLGSGKQWFPWIHIHDAVRGIVYPLEDAHIEGAYNLASPNPVRMDDLYLSLGKVLHRPVWTGLHVPEFALRFVLGEAADSLLHGQRIVPRVLLEAHFSFHYPELDHALEQIIHTTNT
ncbi:MAG: TIGR01777 family oxidoreductase [Bacteroidota bacterium]|nr:TIGR01777 family oxidoreductase [Candidatus Kapabacteria bacterium]MDW8219085.1 TIGR01777 family oxidoreductase [Bacteroidota bacterium]